MSQFPNPNIPAYDSLPRARTSGMAIASMILGILGVLSACVLVGGLFGIIALILGIIAVVGINKNPQALGGKGFAITGLTTGIVALVLAPVMFLLLFAGPAIMLPSLGRAREMANRSTCAANLRGLSQSMNVYAADGDVYPIIGANYTSTLASALPGPTGSDSLLLSNKPGGLYSGSAPGNVCQNMWILVIEGQVSSKQFICKSDPATTTPSPATTATGDYRSNFADDTGYSYSFACPWSTTGMGGWWKSDTDAGLPLIADIAPAQGTGSPAANTLDGRNKNANSFNHQREGQNVGYGDGHAEFGRLADMGENGDNIYSANGSGGPSPMGITPSSAANPGIVTRLGTAARPGVGGSIGNWDVSLVPAANGTTHTRQ